MRNLALLLCFMVLSAAPAFGDDLVYVCDDVRPWPPYTYPSQSRNNSDTGQERTGAMVDFFDAIMNRARLSYVVELKPWTRCLKELESFTQAGHAELMMGAAFNEERAKFAYYTRPTHQATKALLYSELEFPNGPDWQGPTDTEDFVVCRVRGFDYSEVIVSATAPSLEVTSLEVALQFIKKGRCQILFSSLEPILGSLLIGKSIVPEGIRYMEYSAGNPNEYHIMISKASPRGKQLVQNLDKIIDELIRDGTRDRIFEPYYSLLR